MTTTPLKDTSRSNPVASLFGTLAVSLGLLLALPIAASAQELFILSTESGLELYQAEKLRGPTLFVTTDQSTIRPEAISGDFQNQTQRSVYGLIGKYSMVDSGLQTTPNGRVLMMAERIDRNPFFDVNIVRSVLFASLQNKQDNSPTTLSENNWIRRLF